jgi:hypothetical protein
MANIWFRLYSEFADDPKVQTMSEPMQLRLVKLMCLRSKDETLDETLQAFQWRITREELSETKKAFLARGFIDEDWNLLNWNRRQFISDSSTERVREYRRRMKRSETLQKEETLEEIINDVTGRNVTVTAPEQIQSRTDTEAEQIEREDRAKANLSGRESAERLRNKVETLHETFHAPSKTQRLNPLTEDISLLVRQIVCAYPKSRLRSLVADEVRPSEEQAVVVALIAEQARQGGTERGIAGYLLDRAQLFASKVPEDQWRYLPKVQDFFSGLEYRREPEDMIHARNGGSGNGKRSGSSGKGTDGNADALREFLASKGIVRPDADHGDQRLADEPGRGAQPQDELDSAVELRGQPRGPDAGGHHPRVHEGTGRGELLAHPVTPKRAMWP